MKLGFLTGKIDDIAKAKRLGFDAVELSTGAFGRAEDRVLDAEKIERAAQLCKENDIEITALAAYSAAFSSPEKNDVLPAYMLAFEAAEQLGVRVIASMSGFDSSQKWDANLQLWADRFGPVAQEAERRGMCIAFENWMSVHGRLPHKPINFGGCPNLWNAWFKLVPSKALGIEFDPSHLYWQGIDHIRALKEYKDRVYHVHAKDTEMMPEARYRGGITGDIFRFRIPGYGEINWTHFIAALDEIGYEGGLAIEHEDPIYEGERFDEGLERGWQTLYPLLHPSRITSK